MNSDSSIYQNLISLTANTSLLNSNNDLTGFPNPAKTYTNVFFKSQQNCTLEFLNEKGIVLQTKNIAVKGEATVKLMLNNYAAGVYFIRLTNGKSMQSIKDRKTVIYILIWFVQQLITINFIMNLKDMFDKC